MPLYSDLYHYGVGGGGYGGILPSSSGSAYGSSSSYTPVPTFVPSFASYGRTASSALSSLGAIPSITGSTGYSSGPSSRSAFAAINRHYKPMLTTITESAYQAGRSRPRHSAAVSAMTTSLTRINSPKYNVSSHLSGGAAAGSSYTAPRPIQINTADIDVSSARYHRAAAAAATTTVSPRTSSRTPERSGSGAYDSGIQSSASSSSTGSTTASSGVGAVANESPFMPRIDHNDPPHRCTIKRDRNIVRLSTMRQRSKSKSRGEQHRESTHSASQSPRSSANRGSTPASPTSPRSPHSPHSPGASFSSSSYTHSPSPEKGGSGAVKSSWRDRFGDDLLTNRKEPPRKSPGELILERHIIRDNRARARQEAALAAELRRAKTELREQEARVHHSGSRRAAALMRCPSFKDICKDISADIRHNDDLNAGELRQRRASLIQDEENQILAGLRMREQDAQDGRCEEEPVMEECVVMVRKSHRRSTKLPYRISVSPVVVSVQMEEEQPAAVELATEEAEPVIVRQHSPGKWKATVEHVAEEHSADHKVFKLPKKKVAAAAAKPKQQLQKSASGEDFWGAIGSRETVYLDERRRQLLAKELERKEQEKLAEAVERQEQAVKASRRAKEEAEEESRRAKEEAKKADADRKALEAEQKAQAKAKEDADRKALETKQIAEAKAREEAVRKALVAKQKAEAKAKAEADRKALEAKQKAETEAKAEADRKVLAAKLIAEAKAREEAKAAEAAQKALDDQLKAQARAKEQADKEVAQRKRVADMEAQMAKIDAMLSVKSENDKNTAVKEAIKDVEAEKIAVQKKRVDAMDAQMAKIDAILAEKKVPTPQHRSSLEEKKTKITKPDAPTTSVSNATTPTTSPTTDNITATAPAAKKVVRKVQKAKTSNLDQSIAKMTPATSAATTTAAASTIEPQPTDAAAIDGSDKTAPKAATTITTIKKSKAKSPRESEAGAQASPTPKPRKSKEAAGAADGSTATTANGSPKKRLKKSTGDAQPITAMPAITSVARKVKSDQNALASAVQTATLTTATAAMPTTGDRPGLAAATTTTTCAVATVAATADVAANMRNDQPGAAQKPKPSKQQPQAAAIDGVGLYLAANAGNVAKSPETRAKQTISPSAGSPQSGAATSNKDAAAAAVVAASKSAATSAISSPANASATAAISGADDVVAAPIESGSAADGTTPSSAARPRPVLVGTKKPLHAVTSKMPASLKERLAKEQAASAVAVKDGADQATPPPSDAAPAKAATANRLLSGTAAAATTGDAITNNNTASSASNNNLSKFSATLANLTSLPSPSPSQPPSAAVARGRPSQTPGSKSSARHSADPTADNDNDSYCLSGEESEIWSVHYSDAEATDVEEDAMGLKPRHRPKRNRTKVGPAGQVTGDGAAAGAAAPFDPKAKVMLDTKRKCFIVEEAPKYPMIATPRPLQKRWHYFSSDSDNSDPPSVTPSGSSSSETEEEDSDEDDDGEEEEEEEDDEDGGHRGSDDGCNYNVRLLPGERRGSVETPAKAGDSAAGSSTAASAAGTSGGGAATVRMSTCSNDSGFEGGGTAPASPKKMLETSYTFAQFQRSGRITAPATTIPRFKKYAVDDFHFLTVLGKGSFGKVLLAELRNTEYYYAVKCLKKDVVLEDDDVECTLIERKVLALGTNHPYLCHLFCTFQTESHLFFVMEYLNGGDLMFHIQVSGRFPEPRAKFYAAEIISGLKFLHKKGIIYRDLKLDNILLDFDGHVRIADFGMCKLQIYLDRTADSFCGTPDYMAPEVIKGQNYNQSVDWWSFGVLLYEMLIGQSPFSGCDEDELFWSICNELPWYPYYISKDALNLLSKLMEKDANVRMGAPQSPHEDIMESDFFYDIDWKRLEKRQLAPPFKPQVKHPLDTQYFDRAFTRERVRLTPIDKEILQSMDQQQFQGFTYTNPNATPS